MANVRDYLKEKEKDWAPEKRLIIEKESAATNLPYFTEAFSLCCWQRL